MASGGGARYFIGGFTGSDGQAEPFTADGATLFLNAINVLAIPEPSAALVGSLGLLVLLRPRRDWYLFRISAGHP